jgi:adenosylhomocysteine nucleosidase
METIGIVAAMKQESEALLRRVKGWERIQVGPLRGYSFAVSRQTCVLVTSGMGVRRASEATRILVEKTAQTGTPQLLISFGIAGAVEADLQIGDVILADTVCWFRQGILSPLQPLEDWSDAAREAISQALAPRGRRPLSGTAVTTGGTQVLEGQFVELSHPILEMETAGIARVAAEKGIPLRSLRAISDGPRAPIPVDLGEVMDEDANLKVDRLIRAIVRNPRLIFQSRRMKWNTRVACDNAAVALVAALSASP